MFMRYLQRSFSAQLFSLLASLVLILILTGCNPATATNTKSITPTPATSAAATPTNSSDTSATPTTSTTPTTTATATQTAPQTTPPPTAFNVTGISVSVNPKTTCSSDTIFTYSATIRVPAGTDGGTVSYTWLRFDNVPMPTQSVTFKPGQTQATVTTTWQKAIVWTSGEQYWEALKITRPNSFTSAKAMGTYSCDRTVTSINTSATPNTYPCAQNPTDFTVTATITVSNSPHTVEVIFYWRFSDGTGTGYNSIVVPAGQTQVTATTSWSMDLATPNGDYEAKIIVMTPNSFSSTTTVHKSC